MNFGNIVTAIIGVLLFAAPASSQQDRLKILDGTWVSVNREGSQIIFHRGSGAVRQASLPELGHVTVTVSDGKDGSNLKVSGQGFDCYYRFASIGPREMTWDLKSGSSTCPRSDHFKKTTP